MNNQENYWLLFSKKLSNEATTNELLELENLIKDHPEWQYAIQNLEDLWKHEPEKDQHHVDDAFLLHIHRMKELGVPFGEMPDKMPVKNKIGYIKWYWAAAAAVVIGGFLIFSGFFSNNNDKTEIARQVNEISTRPGSKSKVELPDGSVVWLNAGSKLTYNKDFGKKFREVTLVGEGFFDVTKMTEMPFVIHTTTIDVKVLGTQFNVKSYPSDKTTETSLIRGSVEVVVRNREGKIILKPNEKLIVFNEPKIGGNKNLNNKDETEKIPLIVIDKLNYEKDDSIAVETSWTYNKLAFKNEFFIDVAKKMERWYNVSFEFENKSKENMLMYGSFTTETLNEALKAMVFSFDFKYRIEHNKVMIY